jgi:hypothetical protein
VESAREIIRYAMVERIVATINEEHGPLELIPASELWAMIQFMADERHNRVVDIHRALLLGAGGEPGG